MGIFIAQKSMPYKHVNQHIWPRIMCLNQQRALSQLLNILEFKLFFYDLKLKIKLWLNEHAMTHHNY